LNNDVSVYVNDQQQWQFIREMGLTKEEQYELCTSKPTVKVFSKFWGRGEISQAESGSVSDGSVVHPLMAYAELIQIGDQLSRDAANQIASRYFV